MFDANLRYSWNRWKAHLEVTDMFDRRYSEIRNISMPGRCLKFGIGRDIKTGFEHRLFPAGLGLFYLAGEL